MGRFFIIIWMFVFVVNSVPVVRGQELFEAKKREILTGTQSEEEKIHALFALAIRNAQSDPLQGMKLLEEVQHAFGIDSLQNCLYAKLQSRFGILNYYLTDFNVALDYFYQALELQKNGCEDTDIAFSLNAIGNVFMSMGDYEKAIEYYEQSLSLKRRLNNPNLLTGTLGNMGTAYTSMKYFSKADSCFQEVLSILIEQDKMNYKGLATVYNNMGILYKSQTQYDLALQSNLEALQFAKMDTENLWLYTYILNSITEIYILQHNYEYAKKYLDRTLKELDDLKSDDLLMFAYRNAAYYYAGIGDLEHNMDYFMKYADLKDLVFSNEKQRMLVEAQVKYETEQTAKENVLQKLEIEKGQRVQALMLVFFLLLLLVLAVFFFIYKNRLTQSREKEILSATIKTEERERTRFAEELHDSLGALLSSMRIYTDILQTQFQQSSYDKDALSSNFETLNSLLNDAITTTKEVSNSLIPNVLTDFGLIDTLNSYFKKINSSDTINIDFEVDERIERFEPNEEIAYFRIISELLNNTLKHAQAENVAIKLGIKKDKLFISYTDDGIGFNYRSNMNKKGAMGLQNIASRAKSIGAEYDIKSATGRGFSFYLTKTMS